MKMYVRYFIIGFLSLVSSCVNEKEDAGMQPDAVEVGDVLPEFTVSPQTTIDWKNMRKFARATFVHIVLQYGVRGLSP